VVFPTRFDPNTTGALEARRGVLAAYLNPIPGLPPDVGDAEIFNSDPILVAGYNQFYIDLHSVGIPLNTVTLSLIYVDPVTLVQLTADILGSLAGPHDTRFPFGAGTGVLDPLPWVVFVVQVTSNDGGVVGSQLSYKLWCSKT
jgi:hypothetical protein